MQEDLEGRREGEVEVLFLDRFSPYLSSPVGVIDVVIVMFIIKVRVVNFQLLCLVGVGVNVTITITVLIIMIVIISSSMVYLLLLLLFLLLQRIGNIDPFHEQYI